MKKLLIIVLILFIFNCGEKVREEITERYDDGKMKTLVKFKSSGSKKMVRKREYSENGQIVKETYYKNGKK